MKCDCLNDCGDDPWLRTGQVEPCERLQEVRARRLQLEADIAVLNKLCARLKSKRQSDALRRILVRTHVA